MPSVEMEPQPGFEPEASLSFWNRITKPARHHDARHGKTELQQTGHVCNAIRMPYGRDILI